MKNLNEILTFEEENEHVFAHLEHDVKQKKSYSTPKIYTASDNLEKRWYVYFSFRNPETGKLDRQQNIYGTANRHKSKTSRKAMLTVYRKRLIKLLKEGYNPYKDNTDLFQKRKEKILKKALVPVQRNIVVERPAKMTLPPQEVIKAPEFDRTPEFAKTPEVEKPVEIEKPVEENKKTLREAFDFALTMKEKVVGRTTYVDYKNKAKTFVKYVAEFHPDIKSADQLNKKVVMDFLNGVLMEGTSRNRNNYRTSLSSLMQVLEDNEMMNSNIMKKTPALKSIPTRHKTYTEAKQKLIFEHLEKEDPILLLYIKFVSYNLLRPVEVCRLRIKDIDVEKRTLQFKAKNSPLKIKIIPKLLFDELPDLSKLDPNSFLFAPNEIGGFWDATENNRRDYFSKRFNTMVKKPFQLGRDYTLYGFRHTFISKLYRSLAKGSNPFAAKSKLMQITGHSTMTALEKYLRTIDAELPEDYSDMLM